PAGDAGRDTEHGAEQTPQQFRSAELAAAPAPVISVLIPDRETAFAAWNFLLDNGVYVNMAIPPGTPGKESLLRLAVSSAHTSDDIDRLVAAYGAMAEAFPCAKVTG
ncbi:MAG: hypothetical protein AAB227_04135, partial [Pseudomonadota bacterium]